MPTFERAQVGDIGVLMQYMEAFHNFDHAEPFDHLPARMAMEKIVMQPEVGQVWLIKEARETVGYLVLTFSYRLEYRSRYAFLDELYVSRPYRGKGIGTVALAFIKETCRQIGIGKLQQDNPAALTLYEKAGLQQQERTLLLWNLLDT